MSMDEQYQAWRQAKRSVRVPDGFERTVMRRVSAEEVPRREGRPVGPTQWRGRWVAIGKAAAVVAAAVVGLVRAAIVLQSLLLPA